MIGWPSPLRRKPSLVISERKVAALAARLARRSSPVGDHVQDAERGDGDRGHQGIGEEIGAGALAEHLDHLAACGGVAAGGAAERLAERARQDIDAALDAAVLGGASALGANKADGVAVVDHHQGVMPLGEVADAREVRDDAVHREDAVGGDQAGAGVGGIDESAFELGHVVVRVTKTAGLAKTDAVDDRGMVESVGDDRILGAEQRLEEASVGVEAGTVQDGVLHPEEAGEARFQRLVRFLGAADEADRGHAVALAVEGLFRGGDQAG